jgi:UDP-N-acetylmuramoylalanine--D-glutamate ligase
VTKLTGDEHIVIVGLGITGLSCARYLAARDIAFTVMDSRENPPGLAELEGINQLQEVILGHFDKRKLETASEIWLSPGVSLAHPDIAAIRDEVTVRGDVDVFSRQVKAPVIAITGSNGKSTVTTMVGEMARACGKNVAVGGNLGTPVLDMLADDNDLYVVELSSFQLETTEKLGATAATILNVSQDHMDRYLSMAAYHQAKLKIFNGCQHMILNRQDSLARPASAESADITWFGLTSPEPGGFGISEDDSGTLFLAKGKEHLLPVGQMLVKGRHNWANALASLALAEAVGLDREICLATLRQFSGLPHRCEWICRYQGVDYINDSKATNVGATLAALDGLGPVTTGKLILIAGGQGKNQDFNPLYSGIERWVSSAIVMGEDAVLLREGFAAFIPVHLVTSMQEAVAVAADIAKPGDTVVLSPACASFDMFASYGDRGDCFKQIVRTLEQAATSL